MRERCQADVSFIEGATDLDGSAVASVDRATARAGAAGAVAEGRRIDHRSGEVTDYHRFAGRIRAALGEPAAGGSASLQGEVFLEYTTAADGTPLWLRVRTATSSSEALRGVPARRVVAGRGVEPGNADVEERVVSLDLSDPGNSEPAVAFVEALRSRLRPGRLARLATTVGERMAAAGRVEVRGYSRHSRRSSISGDLALGLKVGGQVTGGREVRRLTSAYTRPAGATTYFQRGDCLG